MTKHEFFRTHYEVPAEMLLDFLQQAMAALPTVTWYELSGNDRIDFRTSFTLTSWGERMVAEVEADGADGAVLSVRGEPKVGLLSTPWGEEVHAATIETQLLGAVAALVTAARANPFVMLQADHRRVEAIFTRIGASEHEHRVEVVGELLRALRVHMDLEETHIYPLLGEHVDARSSAEAEVEHELVRDGLAQLEELTPDEPGFDGALTMVVAGVEHHVLEEETEAFPRLAAELGPERLAELADQLTAARAELVEQMTKSRTPHNRGSRPAAEAEGRPDADVPQPEGPNEGRPVAGQSSRTGRTSEEGRCRRLLPHDESRAGQGPELNSPTTASAPRARRCREVAVDGGAAAIAAPPFTRPSCWEAHMRVVVTGATGNVGTQLVAALAADPSIHEVVGVARRRPHYGSDKVTWTACDIERDDLGLVAGADAVVHLAWKIQPQHDEAALLRTNLVGTRRLLDAVLVHHVPALVVASSVGTYAPGPKEAVDERWPATGIPTSSYSRQKAGVEEMLDAVTVLHPELRVVRMRTSLVFQRAAGAGIQRLFLGPLVPHRLPRALRVVPTIRGLCFQATHACDIAEAYRLALHSEADGAFNIAADPPLTPRVMAAAAGARTVPVPGALLRAAMAASWRMRLQRSEPGWLDMARETPLMDTARARQVLGWAPTVSAVDAFTELLGGMGEGAGTATPPLHPQPDGPLLHAGAHPVVEDDFRDGG